MFCTGIGLIILGTAHLHGQNDPRQAAARDSSSRIEQREIVVLPESPADLRIIESIRLTVGVIAPEGEARPETLTVLHLAAGARALAAVGGDLPAERVRHEPPHVILIEPPVARPFTTTLTYHLPNVRSGLAFQAALPTDRLVISVMRGVGTVRPTAGLRRVGSSAAGGRDYLTFAADDVAADAVLALRIARDDLTWRERLAALLTTGLGGALALAWVWRRGRGRA